MQSNSFSTHNWEFYSYCIVNAAVYTVPSDYIANTLTLRQGYLMVVDCYSSVNLRSVSTTKLERRIDVVAFSVFLEFCIARNLLKTGCVCFFLR